MSFSVDSVKVSCCCIWRHVPACCSRLSCRSSASFVDGSSYWPFPIFISPSDNWTVPRFQGYLLVSSMWWQSPSEASLVGALQLGSVSTPNVAVTLSMTGFFQSSICILPIFNMYIAEGILLFMVGWVVFRSFICMTMVNSQYLYIYQSNFCSLTSSTISNKIRFAFAASRQLTPFSSYASISKMVILNFLIWFWLNSGWSNLVP